MKTFFAVFCGVFLAIMASVAILVYLHDTQATDLAAENLVTQNAIAAHMHEFRQQLARPSPSPR